MRRVVARMEKPVARGRGLEARIRFSKANLLARENQWREMVARSANRESVRERVLYSNNSSNLFPPLVRGGGIDMR